MKRKEFLAQLERLLWDIPVQEREEALDFYNSYFDDAGEENESSVIQELGSPGKVAAIIKADLGENRKDYGEYTETGYSDGICRSGQVRIRKRKVPAAGNRHSGMAMHMMAGEVMAARMDPAVRKARKGAAARTVQDSMEAAVRDMTALTAEAVTVQGKPIGTEAESCGASLLYL